MAAFSGTKRLIDKHGVFVDYVTVAEGAYNVETGTVENTETSTTIKCYPKRLKITQFNYPNLVGKQAVEFLIPGELFNFTPDTNDKIVYDNDSYSVDSFTSVVAYGKVNLFKVLAVKA